LLNFAYNIERFLLAAVPGQKDPDTFVCQLQRRVFT